MWWMLVTAAVAAPPTVLWTTDGDRTVIHQPDGSLALWGAAGNRLGVLPGPRDLEELCWRGDTLVGRGSTGIWVWDTATPLLLHKLAAFEPPVLSDDGRVLTVGLLTVKIGAPDAPR